MNGSKLITKLEKCVPNEIKNRTVAFQLISDKLPPQAFKSYTEKEIAKTSPIITMLSFREETLIHLLTEYAWAGAMLCLFRVYYEAAKELGTPPETATFSAGWLKMLLARNIEPMLLEGISK